ncbi:unnamed protein product [Cyprideis torosa]|uniref:Uncharacterized protein n=1 Tax=Cyprideis torosa TaxID=163714 RepID=A0A7R8WTK2_9CRUS|nr:unnamed protein product [Cyprideis torosa]CAG0904843.1 unnamed protein product [Cyprideis torosa]
MAREIVWTSNPSKSPSCPIFPTATWKDWSEKTFGLRTGAKARTNGKKLGNGMPSRISSKGVLR